MEFNQFIEKLKKEVQLAIGKAVEVSTITVTKNNGVLLQGLILKEKEKNAGPTIYVDDLYVIFKQGRAFREIVSEVLNFYEDNRLKENIDLSFFSNFARVKENIVYKLINYNKNLELLQDVPHLRFHDLAIVYYYPFFQGELKNAAIVIYHKYLKQWGISMEELHNAASENTPRLLPFKIQHMDDVLKEMFSYQIEMEWNESVSRNAISGHHNHITVKEDWVSEVTQQMMESMEANREQISMYVISNHERLFGAAALLYPDVLEEFSGKVNSSLWVLPSSIHEVIVIPDTDKEDFEKLKEMVQEINLTQLDKEEILSDSIYFFNKDKKELEMP